MIPKRVTLRNFLSFGDDEQTLDFTEDEALWILTGPNGVGKSAVFDAITYCLFAEHRGGKTDAKSLIRHGASALRASFEFEFGGVDYRITRSRGKSPTQRVERKEADGWFPVAGINGADEVNDWVENTLGLDYVAFTKSVLLRQGESDAIILAKGTERLEMLKKIIDVDRFERLSNRIAEAMKGHHATLKSLQQRRSNTREVTSEEVEAAKAAFAAAEQERDAAQAGALAAATAVERARQFEKLEAERRDLDEKLTEADARDRERKRIEDEHANLEELTRTLPALHALNEARVRIAAAEIAQASDSASLAKRSDECGTAAAALATAREQAASLQSASEDHEHAAAKLAEEIQRETACLSTAENVAALRLQLQEFPPNLDEQWLAAKEASRAADEAMLAATTVRADADSRQKQVKSRQQEFQSVGATCSRCGQAVTEKHAADERRKLELEAAAAAKQFADADLALATTRSEKLRSRETADSLGEQVRRRDEAQSSFQLQKGLLDKVQIESDPTKLKSALEAKRAQEAEHRAAANRDATKARSAMAEAKQIDDRLKTLESERNTLADRIRNRGTKLAADCSARDTLLGQLDAKWHGDFDLDALNQSHATLAASGIAARFAALRSDSENQGRWKARRSAIQDELATLPHTSLAEAMEAETEAGHRAAKANANRDAARSEVDSLERAIAELRELVAAVAAAETLHTRHQKLNQWLGKEGLLRELVRDAEREIVHHAQDTLRSLSDGDLEIELQGPSDGKDEALVLLVRRAGDPDPIPVRFLSGSQKFRVAVALAVAIGKFAAGPAAAKPLESVIIDEGFGSLDKDGLAAMREELDNLRNHSPALKRIILVSHQEEFTKSFPVGYTLAPGESGTVATPFRHGSH